MKLEEETKLCLRFAVAAVKTGTLSKTQPVQTGKPSSSSKSDCSSSEKKVKLNAESEIELTNEEVERRFQLVHSVGEECVSDEDLRRLLSKKANFILYDGFEPSGRMHIAQGVFKALNVNKCTSAGGTFVFWVADWFGLMNDKMGGDLEKIKVVGQYFIEVWKASGMNLENVVFRWASHDIVNNAQAYWDKMLDIARCFTLSRIKKCCQIMGRTEGNLTAAQILYPLMQCSDIFFLKADVCQLGVDQRKVNMLAREYCDMIGRKLKPVILSHHMLYGLAEGQAKMSKSNPDSAIFMEDTAEDVKRKLDSAYCPRIPVNDENSLREDYAVVKDDLMNPCLDYVKHIVMSKPNPLFIADGQKFKTYEETKAAFLSGLLSERNLKNALVEEINKLLEPVRNHFASDKHAKEVLAMVKKFNRETSNSPSRLTRVSLASISDTGGGKCVAVIAPRPNEQTWNQLGAVLNTREALLRAHCVAKDKGANGGVILYLPDLSTFASNSFGDDKKRSPKDYLYSAFDIFVSALDVLGALMDVVVLRQSEIMESNSSDYWMSVINVGRHFQLQDVHAAVGLEHNRVGKVVAALMHCGDVQALAPHTLVAVENSEESVLNELAVRYILACQDHENTIPIPRLESVAGKNAILSIEGASTVVQLLLSDKFKGNVQKKLKQAFCEPGNATVNPVLDLIEALVFSANNGESIEVKTTNGLVKYYSAAKLRQDCSLEAEIHPVDLKTALQPFVAATYEKIEKSYLSIDKKVRDMLERYKPR